MTHTNRRDGVMKHEIKKTLSAIIALSNEAKRITDETLECNNLEALSNRIGERLQLIINLNK